MTIRPAGLICGFAVLLSGCASIPREADFDQVQDLVNERITQRVQWYQAAEIDAEVEQAVQEMLQEELTADSAVQIALLKNRRLQALYEDLGVAQADLVQAGLLSNPFFRAEARLGAGTELEFSVAQDFISIFQRPLRRRVAQAAFEAAKLRVANAVLDHAAHVRIAFHDLQAAMQLQEMFEMVVLATEASLEVARRLHDAGNIPNLELAHQQASFEQARLDLAGAQANVIDRREGLNALLGLWGQQTAEWTIARRLPELPLDEVTLPGLESLAVSQRLDLSAARQEVEVFAESLGLTRAGTLFPTFTVGAGVDRKRDGDWLAGPDVAFPIPLFDQGQAALARGTSQLRQSWQRYTALAVEIRSDVRRLHNQMLAARERAHHYHGMVLPLRNRITHETQLHYNAMQVGVFQLLLARQQELEAGRAYIQTLRDYWIARSELERAVGGRLPGHTIEHGEQP